MSQSRHLDRRHRLGHTLLEMMLSLVLLSIVMASIGSAVMFASSAIPDEDSPMTSLTRDSEVIGQIAEDVAVARYILEQTDHAITVVVSDRTGDGIPDRLRYAWSGTAGDPLTLKLNGQEAVPVLDSVAVFSLAYTTKTTSKTLPRAFYFGNEKILDAYNTVNSGSTVGSKPGQWFGQVINPLMETAALGFLPTKVDLYSGSKLPSDGTGILSLSALSHGQTGDAFADAPLLENELSGNVDWNTIAFQRRSVVPKGQGLALVVGYASGTNEVIVLSKQSVSSGLLGLGGSEGGFLDSSNGLDWAQDNGKSLVYRVYGKELMRQSIQYAVQREHLNTIQISLQSATQSRSPLTRKVQMLLAPPVLQAFAQTDFDTNPTTVDLNADGSPEWVHSTGTMPAGSVSGGLWSCNGELIFKPAGLSSAGVITVNARMRSYDTLGPTIYGPFTVNSSGELLPIAIQLRSDGDGGQELAIYNNTTTSDELVVIPDLPAGLVDVALMVVPAADLIYIEVRGEPAACFKLERIADPGTIDQAIRIGSSGGVAQFDSIDIRVGGTYSYEAEDDASDGLSGGLIGGLLNLLF